MKRYFLVFKKLMYLSFIADLEFRSNILIRCVTDVAWYSAQISTFEIIFRFVPTIGVWAKEEMRIYIFYLYCVDALFMFFFHDSLDAIPFKVRKGELDMLLAKPLSSQFLLSFQKMSFAFVPNLFFVFGGLAVFLWRLDPQLSLGRFCAALALMPGSLAVYYFVRFTLASTSLFIVKSEGLTSLWYQFYRLTFRPDDFFPGWFRVLMFTVIPIGYLVSFPAKTILFDLSLGRFALFYMVAFVLLWLSSLVWRWGLKRYVSASS